MHQKTAAYRGPLSYFSHYAFPRLFTQSIYGLGMYQKENNVMFIFLKYSDPVNQLWGFFKGPGNALQCCLSLPTLNLLRVIKCLMLSAYSLEFACSYSCVGFTTTPGVILFHPLDWHAKRCMVC